MPQAGMVQVLPEKAILLCHDLCQTSYHPPECFLPHKMPALLQLPTCWQGCCPMSQTKELTMVSIATQQKFPQNSAFVILSFLCTQCEAGLKKHKGCIIPQCGSCDSVPDFVLPGDPVLCRFSRINHKIPWVSCVTDKMQISSVTQ